MRKQIFPWLPAAALFLGPEVYAAANFVEMQTNLGTIEVELLPGQAPVTVENFLSYESEGFYRNTLIHRVVADFVIQGGGHDLQGKQKPTHASIVNEAANGLGNTRGTIAMARTDDPDSATSQFFINAKDNAFLDYDSKTGKAGYAVFGRVTRGMDVVDRIDQLPVYQEFPITPTNTTVFIDATYASESRDPNTAFTRVLLAGDGKGRVTSTPEGVKCGKECISGFPAGTSVKLAAKAAKGSVFSGWRGDCQTPAAGISLSMTQNYNCTAVFTRKK